MREQALTLSAAGNIGPLPDAVVARFLRGRQHLHHQYQELAAKTRQTYLRPGAGERDIDIAVARPDAGVPDVLESLDMGFIPVPSLDSRKASTLFRVRGQELRVDLLTPLAGADRGKPFFVPALNAHAQALRFLDYLIEDPLPVPVFSNTGMALVNVPRPARFALHKLIVSESRGEAFATKTEKDRAQAAQLLEVMLEEMPDAVAAAHKALVARGRGWVSRFGRAVRKVSRDYPRVGEVFSGSS